MLESKWNRLPCREVLTELGVTELVNNPSFSSSFPEPDVTCVARAGLELLACDLEFPLRVKRKPPAPRLPDELS